MFQESRRVVSELVQFFLGEGTRLTFTKRFGNPRVVANECCQAADVWLNGWKDLNARGSIQRSVYHNVVADHSRYSPIAN